MKKVLSIFMSVVILAASCLCFAQAYGFDDLDEGVSEYPVIIVPGYSAAALFTEEGEQVWGPDIGGMALGLLGNIAKTGRALGEFFTGDAQLLGEVVGESDFAGKAMFKNINLTNSDYVIITLADGSELSLPRYKNISISFDVEDGLASR